MPATHPPNVKPKSSMLSRRSPTAASKPLEILRAPSFDGFALAGARIQHAARWCFDLLRRKDAESRPDPARHEETTLNAIARSCSARSRPRPAMQHLAAGAGEADPLRDRASREPGEARSARPATALITNLPACFWRSRRPIAFRCWWPTSSAASSARFMRAGAERSPASSKRASAKCAGSWQRAARSSRSYRSMHPALLLSSRR